MKAMILAAGKGTRMRPITYRVPKPMVQLIRTPVMETIVLHLKEHGVDQIMVNTSYLPGELQSYFGDGHQFGVQIGYSYEGRLVDGDLVGAALGSAGGLKHIQEFSGFFDETFVVLCGDAYIDLDLTALLAFHKASGAVATIATKEVPRHEVEKYGVVVADDDGRVRSFQEKPKAADAQSNLINTGIYLFEPAVLDFVPSGQEFDIGGELFPKLVEAGAPFYSMPMDFNWLDIGSIPDFFEAQRELLTNAYAYVELGREVAPGINVGINVNVPWDQCDISGPVYIGSSTRIEPGVTIQGPCVIGANCVIESGATLSGVFTDDFKRIAGLVNLQNQYLFDRYAIAANGDAIDLREVGCEWLIQDARGEVAMSDLQQLTKLAMVELRGEAQ